MAGSYVEMELREIQTSDDPREHPIIVLGEKDGEREFPIFIGLIEAKALEDSVMVQAGAMEFVHRPMAHDLMLNILDGLGARLNRVLIPRLEAGTFYGILELIDSDGNSVEVDTRPSDALVLAMKRSAPVFVEESVLREVDRGDESD